MLTPTLAAVIRWRHDLGATNGKMAADYRVSTATISRILNRLLWEDVPDFTPPAGTILLRDPAGVYVFMDETERGIAILCQHGWQRVE